MSLPRLRLSDRFLLLASTFSAQGLRILSTIVMARLLTPKDYGLVALVAATSGVASSFGDFGAMRCLVQIRDLPDAEVRSTALAISFGLSLFYAFVTVGCGLWLSFTYDNPQIIGISMIMGITGVTGMLYSFQLGNLSRDMKFGAESRQNIIFAVVQTASGILFAVSGFGMYALALQALTAQIFANFMISRAVKLSLPVHCSRRGFERFWHLGWRTTLAQYLNNIQGTVTSLAVGHVSGPVGLGQFGRARQMRDLVGHNILSAFDRLLFPLFSKSQSDVVLLRSQFIAGCQVVALSSAIGGMFLYICGDELVRILLGAQWKTAGDLLHILSIGLIFGGFGLPCTVLIQAVGKPMVWCKFSMAALPLLGMAVLVGTHHGLPALCLALVATEFAMLIAILFWVLAYLKIGWLEATKEILFVWLAAGASLALDCASRPIVSQMSHPLPEIAGRFAMSFSVLISMAILLNAKATLGIPRRIFQLKEKKQSK